ncbi:hypothetical protein AURDEDRAFT_110284 [Auricularia subglabra TFB-10046 SS5]|nr:hypothetical protein AURDEDRAFT_110284 [Auricularia subglabra TFB-10046 SS5]
MPNLVTLCLEGHRLSSPAQPVSEDIVTKNKSLRSIRLHHVARSLFSRVHSFLLDVGVRNFLYDLKPTWTAQATEANSTIEQVVQQCPRITSMTLDTWNVELVDGDGDSGQDTHIRLFFRLRESSSVFNAAFDLTHITHLTIGEFSLPRETELLPKLPRLTTLRVALASCGHDRLACQYGAFAEPSIFVSSPRAWACPSLRNVQFSHRPLPSTAETCTRIASAMSMATRTERWSNCFCNAALSISLREVHHFVVSALAYERVRLQELKLTGVEPVDPDFVSMMERLYEIADDVVITTVADAATPQDPTDCGSCAKLFS